MTKKNEQNRSNLLFENVEYNKILNVKCDNNDEVSLVSPEM